MPPKGSRKSAPPRSLDELRAIPEPEWSELERERKERSCPNCLIRYRIGQPHPLDFLWIEVPKGTRRMLLAAAREFDEQAERETPGELYTAVDFLDWLLASLREEAA